jgi:hypothetical protein
MALVSDELTDDACESFSGFIMGVGVKLVLLEVEEVIGLMTDGADVVVAVGAITPPLVDGPGTGTFEGCATPAAVSDLDGPSALGGPSNLSSGRRDHPSGIVTPGGRSALPDGMADAFERVPWRCMEDCEGNGEGCLGRGANDPNCGIWGIWKFAASGSAPPFRMRRSLVSSV